MEAAPPGVLTPAMRSPQVLAPEGEGVPEAFETVTDTAADVAAFPAASFAVAVRVCPPFRSSSYPRKRCTAPELSQRRSSLRREETGHSRHRRCRKHSRLPKRFQKVLLRWREN